ncbi:MAG: YceI family protein [Bryobacteraceae bacterium]
MIQATLVLWTLDHMGFSPYTGIFGEVNGSLKLDPKRPNQARVDVRIPVSKVIGGQRWTNPALASSRQGWRETRLLRSQPERGPIRIDYRGGHRAEAESAGN